MVKPTQAPQKSVAELETLVRDYFNSTSLGHEIRNKKGADFFAICSALDVIGDIEIALDSYLALSAVRDDSFEQLGQNYLFFYGVLQALYVQQDAVRELSRCFGVSSVTYWRRIKPIRESRNQAVGHPVRTRKKTSHNIGRHSIGSKSVTMMTSFADKGKASFVQIDVPELIQLQRNATRILLTQVSHRLRRAELGTRIMKRQNKLTDIMHPTTGYMLEKIHQGIHDKNNNQLGENCLSTVHESVLKLFEEIEKDPKYKSAGGIGYLKSEFAHAAKRLQYFFGNRTGRLTVQDADVFLFFYRGKLEELRQIAQEIDDRYKSSADLPRAMEKK